MKLSVLIPTIEERENSYLKLMSAIHAQLRALPTSILTGRIAAITLKADSRPFNRYVLSVDNVPVMEAITLKDNRELTIGEKRQKLLDQASGEYVVFLDDDDDIHPDYIQDILQAIEKKPDVITFNGYMTTNGKSRVNFEIKLEHPYDMHGGVYRRFPNHLAPVRRDIALQIGYDKRKRFQEDYDYAVRLKDSGLCKTSVHINKDLYHYKYIQKKK